MAHVALQMTSSIGEHCDGCGKPFARGQMMNAIEYENGNKAGWFCQACVDFWKANGKPPEKSMDGATT